MATASPTEMLFTHSTAALQTKFSFTPYVLNLKGLDKVYYRGDGNVFFFLLNLREPLKSAHAVEDVCNDIIKWSPKISPSYMDIFHLILIHPQCVNLKNES